MGTREFEDIYEVEVLVRDTAPNFTYIYNNDTVHDLVLQISGGSALIKLVLQDGNYLDEPIQFYEGYGPYKKPIVPPEPFNVASSEKEVAITDNNPGTVKMRYSFFLSVMYKGRVLSDDPTIINEPDSSPPEWKETREPESVSQVVST